MKFQKNNTWKVYPLSNDINNTVINVNEDYTLKPKYRMGPMPKYKHINDVNMDLFCSLQTDENGNIYNESYSKLLSSIVRLQYPSDCLHELNKYLILNHQCHVGLFAAMECLCRIIY